MTTPFMRKTLVLMDKVLKLPIRPRYLLTWNTHTQSLTFNNSVDKTKAWYVTVLFAIAEVLLYFGTVHATIGGFLPKPVLNKQNIYEFCVSVYLHLFWCMWGAYEWIVFTFGSEIASYINALFHFQTNLGRETDQIRVRSFVSNGDLAGKLGFVYVSTIALTYPCFPFVLACKMFKVLIISVLFDYIPLQSLAGILAPLVSLTLFLLHFIIIFPVTLELLGAQMVFGVLVFFIPSVQIYHLKRLTYLASRANTSMLALSEYQKLCLVHTVGTRFITRGAAVGLGFGFYTTIFSITLVVHGYHILPFIHYCLVVITAVFCMVLVHFGLKFTKEAFVLSEEFLKHQRIYSALQTHASRKYMKRCLRSLQTVGFNCGAIGELTSDRATTYLYSIIDNSIACILMTGDIIARYGIV